MVESNVLMRKVSNLLSCVMFLRSLTYANTESRKFVYIANKLKFPRLGNIFKCVHSAKPQQNLLQQSGRRDFVKLYAHIPSSRLVSHFLVSSRSAPILMDADKIKRREYTLGKNMETGQDLTSTTVREASMPISPATESSSSRRETVASRFISSLEKIKKKSNAKQNERTEQNSPPAKVPVLSSSPPSLHETASVIAPDIGITRTEPLYIFVRECTRVLDSTSDNEVLVQDVSEAHVLAAGVHTTSHYLNPVSDTISSEFKSAALISAISYSDGLGVRDMSPTYQYTRPTPTIVSGSSVGPVSKDSEETQTLSILSHKTETGAFDDEADWIEAMPFGTEELSFSSQESEEEGVYKLNKLFGGRLFEEDKQKAKKKWKAKSSEDAKNLRANYFVGLRIWNPEIHAKVKKVQELLLKKKPVLKNAIIPLETLHITLVVLCIANLGEFKRARDCFKECEPLLKDLVKFPIHLEFEGLSNFQDKVLYCQVKSNEPVKILKGVSQILATAFRDAGIKLADSREFKPHLTVLKLSRAPELYKKGIKKIDPAWYVYYKNETFGIQEVQEIQLLRMGSPRDEDGYYSSLESCNFDFSHQHTASEENTKGQKTVDDFVATEDVKKDVRRKIHTLTASMLEQLSENKNAAVESNTKDDPSGNSAANCNANRQDESIV